MTTLMQIYGATGERLYLTSEERQRFYEAAAKRSNRERLFGQMLYWTGCRISEALNMQHGHIDVDVMAVTIRSLKKRVKYDSEGRALPTPVRTIPMPERFIDDLIGAFDLRNMKKTDRVRPLFEFSRTTGWRIIKSIMTDAGLDMSKPHAEPKGLRHAFGIHGIRRNVPLETLRDLMGHTDIATTAIYLQAVGIEKREFTARMWD